MPAARQRGPVGWCGWWKAGFRAPDPQRLWSEAPPDKAKSQVFMTDSWSWSLRSPSRRTAQCRGLESDYLEERGSFCPNALFEPDKDRHNGIRECAHGISRHMSLVRSEVFLIPFPLSSRSVSSTAIEERVLCECAAWALRSELDSS